MSTRLNVLEIGLDNFAGHDVQRENLHKQRRIKCSEHLGSYSLILYSKNIKERFCIEKESDNLTVYRVRGNRVLSFFKIYSLASRIIKLKKIDMISSMDPFGCGFIAYLLRLRFKIPINIQLAFDYFNDYFWEYSSRINRIFYTFLAKIVLRRCDSIRIMSILQKERLTKLGIRVRPLEIIPTPVDIDCIKTDKLDLTIPNKYLKTSKTKLLLYVGRLERGKDLPTLLKAFAVAKKNYKNVRLLIVGMGSEERRLRQFVSDLGISEDVLFLGTVSESLKFSYYSTCDIFVITSKCEGRPTVLSEAALCRKPIVATRFSGTQDLIIDGQTGFVVDIQDYKAFADRLLTLLNNPRMIDEFGEKSYEYVNSKLKDINDIKVLAKFWEETVEKANNQKN